MRPRQALVLSLAVTVVFGAGAGPALSQGASAPPAPAVAARGTTGNGAVPAVPDLGPYRIGPEDVLAITVWKNEAMSRTVIVRPDGKISLPLLNDVQAAGLSPMELRDVLLKALVEYMPGPEVSVIVTEPRSFKVSVIGEVPRPGRYELRSWTTVLDVLALAGGFNQFSARGRIFVLRPEGERMKRVPFNYNKAVSEGGEQDNFYVRAGDIIVVP
jgi:polysaccharide export outer membrane protein